VKKKELKGSITVEMTVIVPMLVFLLMGFIMMLFYYHDKNIIYGAAYETAVAGSMEMRKKESVTEEELTAFCKERLRGKCMLMTTQKINVTIQEEKITVDISSFKKGYSVQVESSAPVTIPEKKIRDRRRLNLEWNEE